MTLTMKNTIFWGVTLFNVVEIYQHVEGHTVQIFSANE
jgi:hypothetical protein